MSRSGSRAIAGVAILGAVTLAPAAPPAWAQALEIDGFAAETLAAPVPLASADPRYLLSVVGTVLDTVTGLVWLATGSCEDLPGLGAFGVATWSAAVEAVSHLEDGVCGLSDGSQPGDWRLPTPEEWMTTVERAVAIGCTTAGAGDPPALTNVAGTACHADGPAVFVDISPFYWASRAEDSDPAMAWFVELSTGFVGTAAKTAELPIWPVRDER